MNAPLGSIPVFWIRIAGYQMWYPEVWFRSRKGSVYSSAKREGYCLRRTRNRAVL